MSDIYTGAGLGGFANARRGRLRSFDSPTHKTVGSIAHRGREVLQI
ncbi:MAG: hypothetical protein ACJ8AB_13285 [Gemmatimonadaceae bacterium]